ncbi:LOW QUALITY PROTEIN: extracellular calcium-sensing receptor-like [Notolabrus celidotus]|uniref:LOW QUALITY PROTEIN: extracellular calcium-sensing receptor-like n=1 Tax=Notolabrus celidotus TaxID=1203425 RepID=UPI00148FDF6A|nr:LOW QUALITY PROTEIN: extracellular calcium-sensing receptor-like [Notolabrus celidotus]
MIGGIFPVYEKEIRRTSTFRSKPPVVKCVGFDLRAYRWIHVMIYTIEEINKDPALLTNITLGYGIFDSCASPTNTLRAALTLASRPEETSTCPPAICALIAEAGSSQSSAVAGALGPFQVPIVSYFSTCACLSDRAKYPSFFRTIPSDYFQAKALAALVRRFGWQWIGAIQSDNEYGQNGVKAFTAEVKKHGVCMAFVMTITRTYTRDKILHIVETIKQSTAKVILAFVEEGDFYPLMQEVVKQNITGIQWIASEAWITASLLSTPEMYPAFGGALGFVVQKMAIPKLKPFLTSISPYADPSAAFVRDFWEMMVTDHLQRVNFRNQFGDDVFFDANGDPPASYDIINWQWRDSQIPVSICSTVCPLGTRKAQIKGKPTCCFDCITCADGSIANTTADCTPCPLEYWSNERKDECIPKTIEFLTYVESMGIALTVVSLIGASLSLVTMIVFICYRETPVIKASNSELSCFLLFSLFLCFLCPLTFMGRPTVWTCMLRHTAFGVTFALCISCVLGKTIVVVTAFKATIPGKKAAAKFGPAQQRIIVCSCTLIQIGICVLWLKLNPPFPDMVFRYSNTKIVLECNTGSEAPFYTVLGYIGILAIICLALAFLARKLPDNFNEAKFITFSMLIFCAVWITFIPAYVSSPGKFIVAVQIFAILSSAFGLLISIFAPKCYIILIKPEKNTKKHVMGKV